MTGTGYTSIDADARAGIEALCNEYLWCVDNYHAELVASLFTADGEWHAPGASWVGREQVTAQWNSRATAGLNHQVRHMMTNIRLLPAEHGEVSGVIGFIVFVGPRDQVSPPEPRMVGEHHDVYRKEHGRWLFRSRRVVPLFPSDWTLL